MSSVLDVTGPAIDGVYTLRYPGRKLAKFTAGGPFLKLTMKFDQMSLKDAVKSFSRK
ncbi:hypothetical protein ACFLZ5_02710 [Thermodesulfobacteriota bacterium]